MQWNGIGDKRDEHTRQIHHASPRLHGEEAGDMAFPCCWNPPGVQEAGAQREADGVVCRGAFLGMLERAASSLHRSKGGTLRLIDGRIVCSIADRIQGARPPFSRQCPHEPSLSRALLGR